MQTYTKTLYNLNGSSAVILPKKWLQKFGEVTDVLIIENGDTLTLSPLAVKPVIIIPVAKAESNSVTAKRTALSEGEQ